VSLAEILASEWGTQAREFMAIGVPESQIIALFGVHVGAESAMMAVKGFAEAPEEVRTYVSLDEVVQEIAPEIVAPVIELASLGETALLAQIQETEMASMPIMDTNIWELLDWILPEELLGLDITPEQLGGTDPGFLGLGAKKTGRVLYDNVWIENGKIKCIRKGEPRTLGYTPRFAKKKYRTKRRRKRLTKRDMYILEVLKQNPEAGALALML